MPKLSASRSLIQDLVAASRVLAAHEVLDAYGHVSARSDRRPERFFMSRSRAPALVGGSCGLMRGHGMTVVGDSVPEAVFRAIYTQMNARLQLQAGQLEGPIEFLSDEEGRRASAANRGTLERPWELWKKSALARK